MSEPLTLYKLIVLYIVDKVDFPLTNSQISSFILDKGYTSTLPFSRSSPSSRKPSWCGRRPSATAPIFL